MPMKFRIWICNKKISRNSRSKVQHQLINKVLLSAKVGIIKLITIKISPNKKVTTNLDKTNVCQMDSNHQRLK